MSAVTHRLLDGLRILSPVRVIRLDRETSGWKIGASEPIGHDVDWIVLAVPAPQATELISSVGALAEAIKRVDLAPCLAAMIAYPEPVPVDFDGAFITESPLAWAARNTSKPGRSGQECWVLHATESFSRDHLESDPTETATLLEEEFAKASGRDRPAPDRLIGHRWRYAKTVRPLGAPCLADEHLRIGLCGDWCLGNRVEDAYISGSAMAERMG